jgi:hypothetical protein
VFRVSDVWSRAGDLGFEVGDAPVLEAEVGACGLEPFVEGAVVGGEPLDGLLGPLGLQVADLAEEFTDAGALGDDLGVPRGPAKTSESRCVEQRGVGRCRAIGSFLSVESMTESDLSMGLARSRY